MEGASQSLRRTDSVNVVMSKERTKELQQSFANAEELEDRHFTRPENTPPLWPALLVTFLHNSSMGAALMIWIDVCKAAVGEEGSDTDAQRLYGRLLAMNAICELVTSQAVGSFSDRFGRRPIQCCAQVGQLVDYFTAAMVLPAMGIFPDWKVPIAGAIPLLYVTRGFAGMAGNYRVTVQSYAADISSPAAVPKNLGFVGGSIVLGLSFGGGLVAATSLVEVPYRLNYYFAVAANFGCILLTTFSWRDVAPRRSFTYSMLNPFSGIGLLTKNKTMETYGVVIFLSSFAFNIYTSTIAHYSGTFLGMSKTQFSALGVWWAILSAFGMGVVQPWACARWGEIRTLRLSFVLLIVYYILSSLVTADTWFLSFAFVPFFSMCAMAYPISVGLACREVNADEQGRLQGAVSVLETLGKIGAPLLASDIVIPMFDEPGQFHGMLYIVSAVIVLPGLYLMCRMDDRVETYTSRRSLGAEMSQQKSHGGVPERHSIIPENKPPSLKEPIKSS